eukprot:14257135-Heterocapsa_arctica.AAC.1
MDEDAEADDGSEILLQRRPRPQTRGHRIFKAPSNAVALAELEEGESFSCGSESCAGVSRASARRSRHTPVGTGSTKMPPARLCAGRPSASLA